MNSLHDIKIFWKIFLALLSVGLVSTLAISSVSYFIGKQSVEEEAFRKLTAIREAKATHIENEMRAIRNQMLIFASDTRVVEALKGFEKGFVEIEKEAQAAPEAVKVSRKRVKQFFERKFIPDFNEHSHTPLYAEDLQAENPAAVILQDRYIASNPNPVGEKHLLADAGDGSLYSKVHAKFHPFFKDFQDRFNYHDIHLIDSETGEMVYSVFKEVDFARNMSDPLLRGSSMGDAFRRSNDPAMFPGSTVLEDYKEFFAAHNAPVSFIATPIFDGERKIGILLFEMPVGRVNDIMTNGHRWGDVGQGESGETYLVGPDKTLRSESRFFLTDKANYFKSLRKSETTPESIIRLISNMNTSIGLQTVQTPGVTHALAGESGEMAFDDYRGIRVLSSYQPVKVDGVQWVLLSEIDRAEAMLPLHRQAIMIAISFGGLLLVIMFFARLVSRYISNPLINLSAMMGEVEGSGDLSLRMEKFQDDEIGSTVQNFHSLLGRWKRTLLSVQEDTGKLLAGELQGQGEIVTPLGNKDVLGVSLRDITEALRKYHQDNIDRVWCDQGLAALNDKLRGEQTPKVMADKVLRFIAEYLEAQVGVVYLSNVDASVSMVASYAFPARKNLQTVIEPGDGVVGQVLLEKKTILMKEVGEEYIPVQSGLGKDRPRNIMVVPLVANEQVEAVVELGTLHDFTPLQVEFLEHASEGVAIALASAKSRIRTQQLLEYSQDQADKLQTQTEELQNQTAELEAQQEQLRDTNHELEERSKLLEQQGNEIVAHNTRLEEARQLLEQKATELEESNRYKSEFLANMSHELRTPMNSILVLSQTLVDALADKVSAKQRQYLQTIHSSGQGLLALINDILDVSKMEAGKMVVQHEEVSVSDVAASLQTMFQPLAADKGIELRLDIEDDLPMVNTDGQRLEQILRNFLGNAVKFTDSGHVELRISRAMEQKAISNRNYMPSEVVAFAVKDSGIGIASDKLDHVFEAFQQEDGSTSRVYGGTGLGLAISSEFCRLMGGKIELASEQGKGSTFTLLLPISPDVAVVAEKPASSVTNAAPPVAADISNATIAVSEAAVAPRMVSPAEGEEAGDKERPELHGKTILVVDDDMRNIYSMGAILDPHEVEMMVANNGHEALEIIEGNCQIVAVVMDIMMPKMDGYETMRKMRESKKLKDVPIIALTAKVMKDERERCLAAGANEYLPKPVNPEKLLSILQLWLYSAKDRCEL